MARHSLVLIVSLALIGATLSPLLRDPYDDGFPLSTYPMFAQRRPTTLTFHYALGVGRAGERITLSPELVGTGEVLQAMRVLDNAVGGGRPTQTRLCEQIAARVASDPARTDIVAVRLVTGTHEALGYLSAGTLGRETERVRCEVKR